MKVVLLSVNPEASRHKLTISTLPAVLGRGDDADVRIPDRWASRRHCSLEEVEGRLHVRDLGSRHGTLVNRRHVDRAPLEPGDQLTVGMSTFEVQYRPAVARGHFAATG